MLLLKKKSASRAGYERADRLTREEKPYHFILHRFFNSIQLILFQALARQLSGIHPGLSDFLVIVPTHPPLSFHELLIVP